MRACNSASFNATTGSSDSSCLLDWVVGSQIAQRPCTFLDMIEGIVVRPEVGLLSGE